MVNMKINRMGDMIGSSDSGYWTYHSREISTPEWMDILRTKSKYPFPWPNEQYGIQSISKGNKP